MSTSQRVIKNTFFLYGKIIITSICLLLTTRYILKGLGVIDFGVYNLICSTVVMLGFLNDSMTAATQRFMSYAEGAGMTENVVKIFNTSTTVHYIIALAISLVFLVLTPVVFGDYLQIPSDRYSAAMMVYFFMIISTGLNIITVPYNALLIARENMLYFSLLGILNGILKLGVAVSIIYIPSDRLIMYGFLMLIVSVLDILIIRIYCHSKYKECKLALRKYTDKTILKQMLSYAGWQMTYSSSSILSIQGLSLILNSFFGPIMNAAQGVSKQVCGQLMTLSGTMMNALNPVIVKYAGARNQSGMVHAVMVGSKMAFFLGIIVGLPILFELPYLLDIWLTEVPDYAIMFCRYEVVQQLIASFTVALVTMITGKGDIRSFQLFSSLTYILRLPIIYILLCFFANPELAYWVTTIAVVLLCIGRIYYAHIKCGLPVVLFLSKVIAPCMAVSILVCLALTAVVSIFEPSLLRLTASAIISTLTLLVTAYFIALRKDERIMVRNAVITVKNKIQKRK